MAPRTTSFTATPPRDSHPPPATPPRRWRLDTFRALRHRNYRLYFFGQLISLTGTWLQTAALTWLAYDMTGQSRWPALVGAVQVMPTFVLGGWGGTLADRWPKRPLIFGSQALLLVLALLLAGLVLSGTATVWHLLAVATACGLVNAVDLPARLAFVIEMVGREDLVNAVALNSLLFNTARLVGPAAAAVLLRLGPGLCFLLNGLSFVAVLAALAAMRLPPARPAAPGVERGTSLWAGFAYLGRRPQLVLLVVLSGAMSFFGWPVLSLLPAVADRQLGLGKEGYSGLLSAVGGGALVAALAVASFGTGARRGRLLALGVALASAGLGGLALVRDLPAALGFCTLAGGGLILFFATSQAVMQLGSADHNRGRVMGIWSMLLSGAHPLGHLSAGPAADRWGVPPVLGGEALGIAAAGGLVLLAWLALKKGPRTSLTASPSGGAPPNGRPLP
jgi:MFS family permease